MTPLEKIHSMKMPFAELKGVTFTAAELDRVVARMTVRPDLCTTNHTIHGGAVMAFADSVGAAATVINLPADAKGTTTIESKTNFHRRRQGGNDADRDRNAGTSGTAYPGLADPAGNRGRQTRRGGHPDPDGAVRGPRPSQFYLASNPRHGVQHSGLRVTVDVFEKLLVGPGDRDLVIEPQLRGRTRVSTDISWRRRRS